MGESPYFPETVEGATGADRLCLVTPTEGEANPAPLTGTQFLVLAVLPGLGCLTGRIKALLLYFYGQKRQKNTYDVYTYG